MEVVKREHKETKSQLNLVESQRRELTDKITLLADELNSMIILSAVRRKKLFG